MDDNKKQLEKEKNKDDILEQVDSVAEVEQVEEVKVEPEEKKKHIFSRECKKCEEYKAGWQRALADYKNLQKEISERRGEWVQMSEQQILEEFIPVYDHLKLSVMGVEEISPWVEGVKHVLRQFVEILKSHGVEEIKTVGEKFDPTKHEAVSEEEGEGESGVITKQISAGYIMGGRTIKAAKVVVNKLNNFFKHIPKKLQ